MPASARVLPCAWVLLICALATPSLHAQNSTGQPTLAASRAEVIASERDLLKASGEAKQACEEADAADDQLLREGLAPTSLTRTLASAAHLKRQLCDQWKDQKTQAELRVKTARKQLRDVAATAATSPEPTSAAVHGSAETAFVPARIDLETLVGQAKEAQDRVGKERAAAQGVYETVDRATKTALALTAPTDKAWVDKSQHLQAQAKAAREAGRAAQVAANEFLKHALVIQACLITADADCAPLNADTYRRATDARDRMNRQISLSEEARKTLDDTAARIEVAEKWDSESQRSKALVLTKLIEKYPDANAPFTAEGFTMLASSKDKSAAVRLGLPSLLPGGWREVSLLFSAPLSDQVFSHADGLTSLPKVGISYRKGGVGKLFGSETYLQSWAFGLRLGYDKRIYYDDGPILPKASTAVRVSPWDVSLAFIGMDASTERPNSHVLRAAWQRTFKEGATKSKCPTSSGDLLVVECITGAFGAPKALDAAVLSYQFRFARDGFAVSPTLTYNTRSTVTEISLPWYFIRDMDDDKRPFNAGIRADWTSKGKPSITGTPRHSWSFGVFVGTSFSLFSRAE